MVSDRMDSDRMDSAGDQGSYGRPDRYGDFSGFVADDYDAHARRRDARRSHRARR